MMGSRYDDAVMVVMVVDIVMIVVMVVTDFISVFITVYTHHKKRSLNINTRFISCTHRLETTRTKKMMMMTFWRPQQRQPLRQRKPRTW